MCKSASLHLTTFITLFLSLYVHSQSITHLPGDSLVLNGKTIWYETEGRGEPLVLVAGGPGLSHAYFHPYFSSLTDSFRIIYFDAFGSGKSGRDDKTKKYSMAQDVEDIEALRKTLNLGRINLFGHSYGGFVAQLYALKFPASLNKLILSNTLSGGTDMQSYINSLNIEISNQYPERWEKIKKLRAKGYLSSSPEHQAAFDVPGTLYNFYNPENAKKMPRTEPNLYNPDLWYAIAGKDADFVISGELKNFNVKAKLKTLSMPVLVISGRFDRNTRPIYMVQYKHLIPHAEFVMMEKSGHFPFLEQTSETMDIIHNFLKNIKR